MPPPKSILKKTPASAGVHAANSQKPVNERHLQVALHHANIIEQRKIVEGEVLGSIITLMEYPTSPTAHPARPSPSDALYFRKAMIAFQPADYDSLIEERNIADKCGYALCPQPKRKAPSTAKKQFIDTANGVQIVDRKELEVWCSDDCARRALYVKVQLNEEPAWLRQGGYADNIELMLDNEDDHNKSLPLRMKQHGAAAAPADDSDEEGDLAAAWSARDDAMADLALERGEKPGHLSKANKDLIQPQITERATDSAPPQPPSLHSQTSGSTMAIEGHIPRIDKLDLGDDEDEDEDDAQDWDKALPG